VLFGSSLLPFFHRGFMIYLYISTMTLSIIWNQTNPKPDVSIYYLKFIKSTTPGDPLFQQMGITQKNLRIRRFPPSTSCRSVTLTFEGYHWLSFKMESMNPLPSILFSMNVMSLYTNILHNDDVDRPGIKGPLKNHKRKVLSSCSHWYWSITILHLMESILYKSTEPLWEQRWHL
jgi:hypothetical protein